MLTFNSLFCYFKANNITYLILLCITNTPWQQKTHHLFIIIKATHTWNQERWPFWEACFLSINLVIDLKITLFWCFTWHLLFDSNWGNQCLLFGPIYTLEPYWTICVLFHYKFIFFTAKLVWCYYLFFVKKDICVI